jgi:hypothetical protein
MEATLQSSAADFTAANVLKPAGLILEMILLAQTRFGGKEWAFWTWLAVLVAGMGDLRVAAIPRPLTSKPARWCTGTAWKRWLEHSSATITADFVEDCFPATTTRTSMTQFLTAVRSTFE